MSKYIVQIGAFVTKQSYRRYVIQAQSKSEAVSNAKERFEKYHLNSGCVEVGSMMVDCCEEYAE